jgi:hypothetical protein
MNNNNQSSTPTAKEFLNRDESGVFNEIDITQAMIGFAKLHVEAALKEASKKARTENIWEGNTGSEYCDTVVDRKSILSSYPLENIK